MKRDFLHITDFSSEEILAILDLAEEVKIRLKGREDFRPFKNMTMAMIFAKPSTRTRISFETGFFFWAGMRSTSTRMTSKSANVKLSKISQESSAGITI